MLSEYGQSGSAIYRIVNDEVKIVAIHKGNNPDMKLKVATKITMDLIRQLDEWNRYEMQGTFLYQS